MKWKASKYIYRNGQEKTEKTHKKTISILKILSSANRDKSVLVPYMIEQIPPTWADFFISRIGSVASCITNLSWIYSFQGPEFPFSSPETAHS